MPYFGDWPPWFRAFAHTWSFQSAYVLRVLSDRPLPVEVPNIEWQRFTLQELNARAASYTGFSVQKGPYSQCDLKALYGAVFQDVLSDADYWGYIDNDAFYGNLSSFLTDEVLRAHDVVTAKKGLIVGHCSVFRNSAEVNELFLRAENIREVLESADWRGLDEYILTDIVRRDSSIRAYMNRTAVLDWSQMHKAPGRFYWKEGQICGPYGDWAYIHFNVEKKAFRNYDVGIHDCPPELHVYPDGIYVRPRKARRLCFQIRHSLRDAVPHRLRPRIRAIRDRLRGGHHEPGK